jgi:hypothetical protein
MSGTTLIVDGLSSESARVNKDGQLSTFAQVISNSLAASIKGDRYNIGADGFVTLTDDNETPLIYIQNNEPETLGWALTLLSLTTAASDVAGDWFVSFYVNPISGTIITGGDDALIISQNLGSQKPLEATAKIGSTGDTLVGNIKVDRLVPMTPAVVNIPLDAIVMPPGTSFAMTVTPPVGNTSMKVDIGVAVLRLEA